VWWCSEVRKPLVRRLISHNPPPRPEASVAFLSFLAAVVAFDPDLVGAEYSAALCDLGVFMDEPTESISSDDLDVGIDGVG
jgi:hypothetical protein